MLLTNEEIRSEIKALKRLVNTTSSLMDVEDGIDSLNWLCNNLSRERDICTIEQRRENDLHRRELAVIAPALQAKHELMTNPFAA